MAAVVSFAHGPLSPHNTVTDCQGLGRIASPAGPGRPAAMERLSAEQLEEILVRFRVNDPGSASVRWELGLLTAQFQLTFEQLAKIVACFPPSEQVDIVERLASHVLDTDPDFTGKKLLLSRFRANLAWYVRELLDHVPQAAGNQAFYRFHPFAMPVWSASEASEFAKVVARHTRDERNRDRLERHLASKQLGVDFAALSRIIEEFPYPPQSSSESHPSLPLRSSDGHGTSRGEEDIMRPEYQEQPMGVVRASEQFRVLLNVLKPFCWGITVTQVARCCDLLSSHPRVFARLFLDFAASLVINPIRACLVSDHLANATSPLLAERFIARCTARNYLPYSAVFGNLVEHRARHLIFVLDASEYTSTTTETRPGEHMSAFHLGVRELARVLKDQMAPVTDRFISLQSSNQGNVAQKRSNMPFYFNVVVVGGQRFGDKSATDFGGASIAVWSKSMEPASALNVSNCCVFLRQFQPGGPRDLTRACQFLLDKVSSAEWEVEAAHLVTFGPPSRPRDNDPAQSGVSRGVVFPAWQEKQRQQQTASIVGAGRPADYALSAIVDTLHWIDPLGTKERLPSFFPTFIVTTNSPAARLEESTHFVRELAKLAGGGGQFRILSVSPRVRTIEQLLWVRGEKTVLDVSAWLIQGLQFATVVAYVCMLSFSAMLATGEAGPFSCSEVSAKYPRYLDPKPGSMRIWRFMMLALSGMVIHIARPLSRHPSSPEYARQQRVVLVSSPYIIAYCLVSTLAVGAFVHDNLALSSGMVIMQTACLAFLHAGVIRGHRILPWVGSKFTLRATNSLAEELLIGAPVSLGLAIAVFTIFQLISAQVSQAQLGGSLEFTVAIMEVVVQLGVSMLMLARYNDFFFALGSGWLFFSVSQTSGTAALALREESTATNTLFVSGESILQVVLCAFAVALFSFSLFKAYRLATYTLLFGSDAKRMMKRHSGPQQVIIRFQVFNIASVMLLGLANWGRLFVLGGATCAENLWHHLEEDQQSPILLMLPKISFTVTWVAIFCWRSFFALVLALPAETIALSEEQASAYRTADLNIGRADFFRWRSRHSCLLTWRFEHLLVNYIRFGFGQTCLLEMCFLFLFNAGMFWPALLVLFALAVRTWSIILTLFGHSAINVGTARCKNVQSSDSQGSSTGGDTASTGGSSLTASAWRLSQFRDWVSSWLGFPRKDLEPAEDASKDISSGYRLTPLTSPDMECSWAEVLFVRFPCGFYLGWLMYLLVLMCSLVAASGTEVAEEGSEQLAMGLSAWILLALLVLVLVASTGAYWANEPSIVFGVVWSMGCLAVNWLRDVCVPETYAGDWIRKHRTGPGGGLMTQWSTSEDECRGLTDFRYIDGRCRRRFVGPCQDSDSVPGFKVSAVDDFCYEFPGLCPLSRIAGESIIERQIAIWALVALGIATVCWVCVLYLTPSRRRARHASHQEEARNQAMMQFD